MRQVTGVFIDLNPPILTLNISGLNTPIKDKLSDWILKQDPTIYCL